MTRSAPRFDPFDPFVVTQWLRHGGFLANIVVLHGEIAYVQARYEVATKVISPRGLPWGKCRSDS